MSPLRLLLVAFIACAARSRVSGFVPRRCPSSVGGRRGGGGPLAPPRAPRRRGLAAPLAAAPPSGSGGDDGDARCWNPALRRRLAALAALGLLETAGLTYDKLAPPAPGGGAGLAGALCAAAGPASACDDVLRGPYASVTLGSVAVPLASLGAAAYALALALAAAPLLRPPPADPTAGDGGEAAVVADGNNRVALLGVTTLLASFSVYLVSLLTGVLHAFCPLCLASAGLSFALAALAWSGGVLPGTSAGEDGAAAAAAAEPRRRGVAAGASAVGLATVAALGLFLTADDAGASAALPSANVPPRVTTSSSPEALALADDLRSLDARMFGAFWCSHCYDQKQSLGKEAMEVVPYVECDAEGYRSQREVCKEREVPGYPTWEIKGELFPGERSLDELREMVDDVKRGVKPRS